MTINKDDKVKAPIYECLGPFKRALMKITEHIEFGIRKYQPQGWRLQENGIARYRNALYRHVLEYMDGNMIDVDRREHLSAIAVNAMILLELEHPHAINIKAALLADIGVEQDKASKSKGQFDGDS